MPELFKHQIQTLQFHFSKQSSGDLSDVGVGKTPPMVRWIADSGFEKTLVVCPNSILENWQKEIGTWSSLSSVILRGDRKKRFELLEKDYAVYIINYEGVPVIFQKLLFRGFQAIIADEAHHIKNWRGSKKTPTRAWFVRQLARCIRNRKAMTGTVLTNDIEDVWAVCEFVDPKILNMNFWQYRNQYLYNQNSIKCQMRSGVEVQLYFGNVLPAEMEAELTAAGFARFPGLGVTWRAPATHETIVLGQEMVRRGYQNYPKWVPRAGAVEIIKKKIEPYFIRFEKREVLKFLPPILFEKRYVDLSTEQAKAYKDLKKYFIAELAVDECDYCHHDRKFHWGTAPESTTVCQFKLCRCEEFRYPELAALHILSRLTKLIEITSGFAYRDDAPPYRFKQNAKLDELKNLLEMIGKKRVCIWAAFREDISIIHEALAEHAPEIIWGDTPGDQRQDIIDRFNSNSSQYLICNPATAGEGLTILAPYAIYYSRNWKLGERLQSLGRHDRPGAEMFQSVTIFDLIARGGADESVMAQLEGKEDLLKSISPKSFKEMV
jgi:SNF2 family DNA or RNA helicase